MDCILCTNKGYVMVKGYQTDRQFKVECPYCAESEPGEENTGSSEARSSKDCTCCDGSGEVTIEGQDETPRTVNCGHCKGSGNEPDSEGNHKAVQTDGRRDHL